ncbi:MAG: class I SAM-dependent methyltransferase [Candidatus Eisenbacteria bacterium]|nr:class I SAM-dependent methyltransferase [Candidatus Eisenbacteria bacterium]MCC7144022.1 class I SAM-dependent methyltransferase [Candidatus Eisenbacteria bacterium]
MEAAEYDTLRRLEDRFWWYRGLHHLIVAEIVRLAAGRPQLRVLDAGCGTGGLLIRALTRLPNLSVVGLDFSPHALRHARGRGLPRLTRGSVEALPFRAEEFDLIVSLDVLYHRAVEDDDRALREFHRCLRPGGTLLLHLPAFESLRSSHDAAIHTARRYRRAPLAAQLRASGLVPRRVSYRNAALFPALALVRFLRRGQAHGATPPPSDVRPLPAPIDALLYAVLRAEELLLGATDLPWGLSLFTRAERAIDGGRAREARS